MDELSNRQETYLQEMAKRLRDFGFPFLLKLRADIYSQLKFEVNSNEFVVGRAENSSLVLCDLSVSRKQCIFTFRDGYWSLTDESSVGTYVNNHKLMKGEPVRLEHGCVIKFGSTDKFIYKFCLPEYVNGISENKKSRIEDKKSAELRKEIEELQTQLNEVQKRLCEKEPSRQKDNVDYFTAEILKSQIKRLEAESQKIKLSRAYEEMINKMRERRHGTINMNDYGAHTSSHDSTLSDNIDAETKHKLRKNIQELIDKITTCRNNERQLKKEKQIMEISLKMQERLLAEPKELHRKLAEVQAKNQELLKECSLSKAKAELEEQAQMIALKEKREIEERYKSLQKEMKLLLEEKEKQGESNKKQIDEELDRVRKLEGERQRQEEHNQMMMAQLLREVDDREENMRRRLNEAWHKLSYNRVIIEDKIKGISPQEQSGSTKHFEKLKLEEELADVKNNLAMIEKRKDMLEKELEEIQKSATENTLKVKEGILKNFEDLMETELQCSICSELFFTATTLNCNHTFCEYCISEWRKKKNTCPVCRTKIKSQQNQLIFDNFIDKMVENLSDDLKKRREELKREREAVLAKDRKNGRGKSIPHRNASNGRRRRPPSSPEFYDEPLRYRVIDLTSSDSSESSESSESTESSSESDSSVEGNPGSYYGGYGNCYICGRRGHWASGCPDRS